MLPVMINQRINHPFNDEISRTLIRTGTVGDGSCFFHSILTNVSSTYRDTTVDTKKRYIKKFRKKIADAFNINTWHIFPGMELLVQDSIYNHIKERLTCKLDRRVSMMRMRSIASFALFDIDILPRAFDIVSKKYKKAPESNDYIHDLYTYITRYFAIYISDTGCDSDTEENRDNETIQSPHVAKRFGALIEEKEKVIKTFNTFMKDILEKAEKDMFERFKESISNVSTWIHNDILIKHISDMFKINILVIQEDGTPYKMPIVYNEDWVYIMIYYMDGVHFEAMGLYNKDDNTIERKFGHPHEVVQLFLDKLN